MLSAREEALAIDPAGLLVPHHGPTFTAPKTGFVENLDDDEGSHPVHLNVEVGDDVPTFEHPDTRLVDRAQAGGHIAPEVHQSDLSGGHSPVHVDDESLDEPGGLFDGGSGETVRASLCPGDDYNVEMDDTLTSRQNRSLDGKRQGHLATGHGRLTWSRQSERWKR